MDRHITAVLAAIVRPLREVGRGVLDAALPQTCVACGQWMAPGPRLACDACHGEITSLMVLPGCPRCGRTLPTEAIHEHGCARCRGERFWNVAGVVRVGLYRGALRSTVLGLKYDGQERNARYLAELLAAALRDRGWLDALDALVPVPMHWLRRWQRPCDHAHVLTEAVSRIVTVPVLRLVRRTKHSPSQTRITSKNQRFENVRDCFASPWWWAGKDGSPPPHGIRNRVLGWPMRLVPRRWTPDVAGKSVCIIDNLLSTGATVYEVSKVLRRAGAKRIYAAVLTRPAAPGDPPAGLPHELDDDDGPQVNTGERGQELGE